MGKDKWLQCPDCGSYYLQKKGHNWGLCRLMQAVNRQNALNGLRIDEPGDNRIGN